MQRIIMASISVDTRSLSRNTSDAENLMDEHSQMWTVSVATMLSLISLLTIVGNLLMTLSYVRDPRIRSSVGNLYVLNRAIADMIIGIFVIPFSTAFLLLGRWPFGQVSCKIWTVLESSATFVSVLSLLLISLDRYWLVTKKLRYQKFQTQQRAAFLICFCWAFCLVFYGITVFAWRPITHQDIPVNLSNECRIQSRDNVYFALILFLVQFLLPLILIAGLNRVVYKRIRARSRSFVQTNLPTLAATKTKEVSDDQNDQCDLDANAKAKKKTDSASGLQYIDEAVTSVSLISVRTFTAEDSVTTVATDREIESTERSSSYSCTDANAEKITIEMVKDTVFIADNTQETRSPIAIVPNSKPVKATRHRKAGITLAVLISVYIFCWFPYCLVVLLNSGCKGCVPSLIILITTYLHWCISTINPYLYAVLNDKFRLAFSKSLGISQWVSKRDAAVRKIPNYTASATESGFVQSKNVR